MSYFKILFAGFWLLLLGTTANKAHAQITPDTTTVYRVETRDGNEYLGTIIAEDASAIQLKTANLGTIRILRQDIKTLTALGANRLVNGSYWFENPQSTRYLFAPNGYGLKSGEGYYQNVLVLVNQISVGITNNFSMGAGTIPLFFFGIPTPVWLLPKFSIPVVKNQLNVGAGALIGTVLGEDALGFGILYGIITIGSRDKNLSVGLGYGYAEGDLAETPTVTVSGLLRTGSRGYLLTENYFIGTPDGRIGLITAGGRRIIKKVGLDFGLMAPVGSDIDSFLAFPFLGLTVPFGQTQSKLP